QLGGSGQAEQVVQSLRARFSQPDSKDDRSILSSSPLSAASVSQENTSPFFPRTSRSQLVRRDGRIAPKFSEGPQPLVRVSFGEHADSPFELFDSRSGMRVSARLSSAQSSSAEAAKGYLVYRHALGNESDLVHVPTPSGTEDWITVPGPELDSISYEVDFA